MAGTQEISFGMTQHFGRWDDSAESFRKQIASDN